MDLEALLAQMPFAATVGVTLAAASADEVVARLAWSPARTTAGGGMHGGALMALADTAGGACAFLGLPPGATTSTMTSTTSFLRGVRRGSVTATSRPLHRGRTVVVVQTDLRDDEGHLVAQVTQTQAVLPPR